MDKNLQKLISLRIKQLREANGLNQEKFSELVEVDTTTISNIENRKTFLSFHTMCKIALAFKLEPNKFFDFINPKMNNEDILDALILEHLKTTRKNVKKKVLELLEVIEEK